MARLQDKYRSEVVPQLKEKTGRKNVLSLPRLEKVVLSMGLGKAATAGEKDKVEEAQKQLATITGQRPVATIAKKSVSAFRLREGMKIGAKVTLRGKRMYEFCDRLFNIALPRVRDFRGVNHKSFDGHGNYNMGVTEQSIFAEIEMDKVKYPQGMNITFCVANATDEESRELLKLLGMPFKQAT